MTLSKTIFEHDFRGEGFEYYSDSKTYEDGHYIAVRFSPLSGRMYYSIDSAKNGKMQLGILDASFRLFVKKVTEEEMEKFMGE